MTRQDQSALMFNKYLQDAQALGYGGDQAKTIAQVKFQQINTPEGQRNIAAAFGSYQAGQERTFYDKILANPSKFYQVTGIDSSFNPSGQLQETFEGKTGAELVAYKQSPEYQQKLKTGFGPEQTPEILEILAQR